MEYLIKDKKFRYSYQEAKEQYKKFCEMSDDSFRYRADKALHLAIFICYLKEIPTSQCLSDMGIIHELSHLVCGVEPVQDLTTIRQMFKEQLKLS